MNERAVSVSLRHSAMRRWSRRRLGAGINEDRVKPTRPAGPTSEPAQSATPCLAWVREGHTTSRAVEHDSSMNERGQDLWLDRALRNISSTSSVVCANAFKKPRISASLNGPRLSRMYPGSMDCTAGSNCTM